MNLSKQTKTYQEIGTYLKLSEKLLSVIENSQSKRIAKNFYVIEEYIAKLQSYCEELAFCYLSFINGEQKSQNAKKINQIFLNISAINQEYQNLISSKKE